VDGTDEKMGIYIEAHSKNDPGKQPPADDENGGKKTGQENQRYDAVQDSGKKKVVDRVDPEGPEGVQFPVHLHDGDFRVDGRSGSEGDEEDGDERGNFVHGEPDEDISQVLREAERFERLEDDPHDEGTEDDGNGEEQGKNFHGGKVYLTQEDGTGGAVVSPAMKNIPEDAAGYIDGFAEGS